MFKRTRWWLLCCTFSMAAACSSGDDPENPNNGEDPDTGQNGDTGDKPPPPPTGSLEQGDLCDKDAWCSSGFCVKVGNGYSEGVCSQRCEDTFDCDDESWECMPIVGQSTDEIKGCVPAGLCIDRDGDGYGIGPGCQGPDCDDDDPLVYPGAPEICDGKDNDCDGIIDNNLIDEGRDCDTNLLGVCADGITECVDGVRNCNQLQFPSQEICDELDNDCDGLVDETRENDENGNFIANVGTSCRPLGSDCYNGFWICDVDQGGEFCDGLGDDAPEICDGIDNNCNGQIDEGIDGLGVVCNVGKGRCINSAATTCDPDDPYAAPICNIEPRWENVSEEVCDYEDNNCDGTVDGPFINADGVYHLVEHCGGCNDDCGTRWGDVSPAAVHAIPTCKVSGSTATCGFTCETGYFNKDGNPDNGCELKPDPQAIYVTTTAKGGVDSNTCGSHEFPCATITRGIARAKSATKKNVRVSEGVFREGVVLENGISVLGGHSSINWLRDLSLNTTVIYGAATSFPNDAVAMSAKNIDKATEVSGLSLIAPDAPEAGNSIGLLIEGSTNKLVVRDNSIQSGVGGQGVTGQAGSAGTAGKAGGNGKAGNNAILCTSDNTIKGGVGGAQTCGTTNVAGGAGASSSCPTYGAANPSGAATNGRGNTGGEYGKGGFTAYGRKYTPTGGGGSNCLPDPTKIDKSFPSDGLAGNIGTDGGGGAGAQPSAGQLIDSMWRTASGAASSAGIAGGGGGGGGAIHGAEVDGSTRKLLGPTGGGGGSGGCAGASASGGGGGGASFALYIVAGSNTPVIEDNTLTRGLGGQGGIGGIGGTGAFGGAGGVGGASTYNFSNANYCADIGRTGGDGGRGGHGGGGGGGAGGHAHDIAYKGLGASAVNTLTTKNTFVTGASTNTAGQGGDGGPSMGTSGQSGQNGLFGQRFELP